MVKFAGLTPYLHYEDAAAMLDWLARVFGFEEVTRYVDADGRVSVQPQSFVLYTRERR